MDSLISPDARDRARRIQLIIFDVDGVLTDGGIWLFPASGPSLTTAEHADAMKDRGGYGISSQTMVEAKGFNAHDGTGISLGRLGGMKFAIITKRISETVALRARDLRIEHVYMGQAFKMQAVRQIMEKEQVKAAAQYVTPHKGGHGAGRDAVEFILDAKGIPEQIIEQYIDERNLLPANVDIGKGGL